MSDGATRSDAAVDATGEVRGKYRGLKAAGRSALRDHLVARAQAGRGRHGPFPGLASLEALLADRDCVRFPTRVVFDDAAVPPGLFAVVERDAGDETAFRVVVAASLVADAADVPLMVAYHLPSVNYGRMPTADDAEVFGATLLGMDQEDYYHRLCALADARAPAS